MPPLIKCVTGELTKNERPMPSLIALLFTDRIRRMEKVMFSHVSVCLSTPPPTCCTTVGMPLAFTQEDFLV